MDSKNDLWCHVTIYRDSRYLRFDDKVSLTFIRDLLSKEKFTDTTRQKVYSNIVLSLSYLILGIGSSLRL